MTDAELHDILDRIAAGDPRARRVVNRWVNRTEHSVYLFDERVVVKTYTRHPGKQNRWPSWKMERRALERLDGLPVPRCIGHLATHDTSGNKMHAIFKEFVRGEMVPALRDEDIPEFAALMAAIHARRVITNDPKCANLLRTEVGRLAFIDFGRATTHFAREPVYWYMLGKELARTYRKALRAEPRLLAEYFPRYAQALGGVSGGRAALLNAGFRRWCIRKNAAPPPIFP